MLSWKHQANAKIFTTNTQLACRHHNCEWILGVSSPLLHTDSDLLALISVVTSYYRFDVEIHTEFPGRVIVSMREIVGSVVRHCEHNVSLKIHLLHMQ